jgi:hypothetical protein
MVQHARPHLQVHSRGNDHSAVAGAAYRLGLRLYDIRAKKWHDFRRRKLGEEIVRALTIAPEGAPDWASDPGELWNRAEAAEKRKDAQVARDYRIPIPLGLTDQVAGDMAEAMARFIADELHTAVSIGLHRDAEIDALGNVKPNHQQGYHAHLYFPTRRLQEIAQEDGTSSWGFGEKLMILSSKQTGGAFVERLNEHWAALANRFTAANDLPADYDHRSYVRQEVPIEPQPTLGAAVTAMERRGFFTRRGDALRGDILVPAKVYEAAHDIVLEVQREQAVADVVRETGRPVTRAAAASAPSGSPQPEATTDAPIVQAPLSKPALTAAAGSLVARFYAAAPVPNTLEERQVFIRVLKIVGILERVLAALTVLAERFRRHTENYGRRMAAKLDTDYELDACRAQRASAKEKLERWMSTHKWQVVTARAFGGNDGAKPDAWRTLISQFEACQRRVQTMKATLRSHQVFLDNFADDEVELKAQQAEAHQRLRVVLGSFVAMSPEAVGPLMAVSQTDECGWIKAAMPEMAVAPERIPDTPNLSEAVAQLRPFPRRLVGSP